MGWKGNRPSKFTLDVVADATDLQKRIAGDMLQGVILQSPVDTGTFRGNHRVSLNSPDDSFNKNETDENGANTLRKGLGTISSMKLGGLIYIQNSLPYSLRLENGWSQQAAAGVYGVTFAAVSEKYK